MTGSVRLETNSGVATVQLDNVRHRNAMTYEMYQALPEMFEQIAADDSIRVVILRGAGTAAFSAGGDITEFSELRAPGEPARAYNRAVLGAERAIEACDLPTIAMIHGACVGGGCGLALAADLRIADTSLRMGITSARMGLAFGFESVRRLVDAVGRGTAARMLFSAVLLEADEARSERLVDLVYPVEQLEASTLELAHRIAGNSPVSVGSAKRFLRQIAQGTREESSEASRERDASFDSADYREGVTAFLERRSPKF